MEGCTLYPDNAPDVLLAVQGMPPIYSWRYKECP